MGGGDAKTAHVYEGEPDGRQSDRVDERVSRFRPRYRALTEHEKTLHDQIKDKAAELEALFEMVPGGTAVKGRCNALAMTNLEQAVMWSVKALTA